MKVKEFIEKHDNIIWLVIFLTLFLLVFIQKAKMGFYS